MTYDQIKMLLAMAAARDNRKPSHAMAIAWHHDLANVEYDIAVEAMSRHYKYPEPIWLTPQHILAHANAIRAERKRGTAEPLALPGRYETDQDRNERIGRGMQLCREVLAQRRQAVEEPAELDEYEQRRQAAIARARSEARGGDRITQRLSELYPAVVRTVRSGETA